MGVHSGKFGVVDGITTVQNWTVEDQITNVSGYASNTRFGPARRPGPQSWSGTFQQLGHTPTIMPGESIDFKGYIAPGSDVTGDVGQCYLGTALVGQVVVNWDWAAANLINIQTTFAGHLALTVAQSSYDDDSTPTIFSPIGTKVEYSTDGAAWTELTDLTTASLTILSQLQSYVNSSTVIGGKLWTGQKSGPLDWNASVTMQNDARDMFAKGDQIFLRLYVTPTTFYRLDFMRVGGFTGISVDRASGAIVQNTVNFEADVVKDSDGSIGQLVLPSTTVWFPEVTTTVTTTTTTTPTTT